MLGSQAYKISTLNPELMLLYRRDKKGLSLGLPFYPWAQVMTYPIALAGVLAMPGMFRWSRFYTTSWMQMKSGWTGECLQAKPLSNCSFCLPGKKKPPKTTLELDLESSLLKFGTGFRCGSFHRILMKLEELSFSLNAGLHYDCPGIRTFLVLISLFYF